MEKEEQSPLSSQSAAVYDIVNAQQQFAGTTEALRELLDELGPAASSLDQLWAPAAVRNLLRRCSTGSPVEVENRARAFSKTLWDSVIKSDDDQESSSMEASIGVSFRYVVEEDRTNSEDALSIVFSELVDAVGDERLVLYFTTELFSGLPRLRVRRNAMLLRSLVVMSVSALEVLTSALIRSYIGAFPHAFGSDKKEFSLADLRGYASMEEAVEAAVDSKVEDIIRGGFEEWQRWLGAKDRLGVDLESISITSSVVLEAIQARHLLVHTDGIVSKQFVRKTPTTSVTEGDRLPLSVGIVRQYLDAIETFGVLTASTAMTRIDKLSSPLAHKWTFALGFDALKGERWTVANELSRFAARCAPTAMEEMMSNVNSWIARAAADGREAIHNEVAAWDASALDAKFQLARSILIGDDDDAMRLTHDLVDNEIFSVLELAEWPLFRWLREREDFARLLTPHVDDDG